MSFTIEELYPVRSEDQRERVLELIETAPLVDEKGRVLDVVVWRKRPKKDDDDPEVKARRLMHIWIGQCAKAAGDCSPGEMRLAMRRAHLPMVERVDPITGAIFEEPMSTNDLSEDSTPTLSQFLESIKVTASEMWGLQLKSKNERDLFPPEAQRRTAMEDVDGNR